MDNRAIEGAQGSSKLRNFQGSESPRKTLRSVQVLCNPAGGVLYHYLALKYSRSLWKPFTTQIRAWLEGWPVRGHNLVLVGPSGGYSLSPVFLSRFERIVLVDPDFLAHRIFKLRFRKVLKTKSLVVDSSDYFGLGEDGLFDSCFLTSFFERYAGHVLLFCNFLGQLSLLAPSKKESAEQAQERHRSFQDWKKEFLRRLQNGNETWASFHDRLSTSCSFSVPAPSITTHKTTDELLKWLDPASSSKDPFLEVMDHQLENLGMNHNVRYFQWQLFPRRYHLIEACSS